ncbi:MAG: glycosyltransferase involved in cell wall biosynthesis [Candidatus Nitrosomirales archaeon]
MNSSLSSIVPSGTSSAERNTGSSKIANGGNNLVDPLRKGNHLKNNGENGVLVSVIVPTKNSHLTLMRCLETIKGQTYKNIEIIVVDNYSTDNSLELAEKYADAYYLMGPERSSQVNHGVEMASGKYIYRVDSDFLLDPDVVSEAVMEAELNNHGAILIHNSSNPDVSFWAKVRKFERDMYASDDMNVAARFIRRDVFLAVGGFDPNLVAGEDYDLHNRIVNKYSIGKILPKEVHLGEPRSLREVAQKHFYYGRTINLFLEKNKERGIKQVSPIRMAYLHHYKDFCKHPILACGFVVYQIVRYSSALAGVLSARIRP